MAGQHTNFVCGSPCRAAHRRLRLRPEEGWAAVVVLFPSCDPLRRRTWGEGPAALGGPGGKEVPWEVGWNGRWLMW